MKNALLILVLLVGVSSAGFADDRVVALVTKLTGQIHSENKNVEFLDYLEVGQELSLRQGSSATVSMVKGGRRVTLVGPCQVRVTVNGAETLAGNRARISSPKRNVVAAELPVERDLVFSGAIRRGVLELWVGRTVLPSTRRFYFTALPAQDDFVLTIFDSRGQKVEKLLHQESGVFNIEPSTFQPGGAYDFVLDGYSPLGQHSIDRKSQVVVSTVEQELAFREYEKKILSQGSEVEKTELFLQYLSLSLHEEAMALLETLLTSNPESSKLKEYRHQLDTILE